MLKRKIETYLLAKWKKSENRDPLVIKGFRQCGKTYIVQKFANENYESVVCRYYALPAALRYCVLTLFLFLFLGTSAFAEIHISPKVLPEGTILPISRIYDSGWAELYSAKLHGYIREADLTPTTESIPEEHLFSTSTDSMVWDYLSDLWWLLLIPSVVLTVLFSRLYQKTVKKGTPSRFLDFLAGLFLLSFFIVLLIVYSQYYDESIFELCDLRPSSDSDFMDLLVVIGELLIQYIIWKVLLIRYVLWAGSNAMLYLTSFIWFLMMTMNMLVDYIDHTGFMAIIGFFVIPFMSLMFYMWLCFGYINFRRCPRCHATGGKHVTSTSVDDLGLRTEYSREYDNTRDYSESGYGSDYKEVTTYTTKGYDVYKTSRYFDHHLYCSRCDNKWVVRNSLPVSKERILTDVKKETHTKTWE